MRKIHAKNLGASKVTFTNGDNELIHGFKIDLRTKNTETYILLTKEELKPILEELTNFREKNTPEEFYI